MKQFDLFRENANNCLQIAEKAPDHGFVRILQTRRPIENGAANVLEEDPQRRYLNGSLAKAAHLGRER
jgi:hypothetical protein